MQLSLTGHLTRDIYVHKTSKDNDIILGQIATTDYVNGKEVTNYVNFRAFSTDLAEALLPYLKKGTLIDVDARLAQNKRVVDGVNHYEQVVIVNKHGIGLGAK